MSASFNSLIFLQDGLLNRSWVAGVLPSEIMFSHIATQFVVLLGQTGITLIFILLVFGIPCQGPLGWLIVLTILQGFAGMCFGNLISNNLFLTINLLLISQVTCFQRCSRSRRRRCNVRSGASTRCYC